MTRALSQLRPHVEVSEEMEAEGQVELATELGDLGTKGDPIGGQGRTTRGEREQG